MTYTEKETILAFINGVTTTQGETQFYEGEKVIKGDKRKLLINFIKNLPITEREEN